MKICPNSFEKEIQLQLFDGLQEGTIPLSDIAIPLFTTSQAAL